MTIFLLALTMTADPTPIEPAKLTRTAPIDYTADVQPVFAGKCTVCHSGGTTEGRLDMGTHATLMKGGKRGVAIVPGKPAESPLYLFSSHNKKPVMPPRSENNDLTPTEVAILKLWIEQGAKGPAGPEVKVRPKVALTMPAATVVPVRAVAVKPDKALVAVGRGNQLHIYDAKTGKHAKAITDPAVKTAAHLSLIDSLAYSPDGKTIATGSFREVVLWDADAGTVRHRLTGFAHTVTCLAFAPDGKSLVCGGGAPTEDGEVRIFDPASGKLTLELKSPHSDTVYGVAVTADGKRLATGGADKFVKVWELPGGKFAKSFEGHTQHVLDVGWTPDGKRLVSAGADGAIKAWDYEKGEKVRDILQPGKVQMTRLSFVGAKAEFLVAAGDGNVRLMNPDGGTVRGYAGATDFVYAVAAAADGSVVVAGGEDGVARLYDAGGKLVGSLVPPAK